MDIQNILTTAIEIVFMGFVSLMVYDFIDGLWVVPLLPAPETIDTPSTAPRMTLATPKPEVIIATPSISTTPQSPVTTPDPWEEQQFEQLPDPWITTDIQPQNQTQPIVLPFPTLRLLPPAPAKVQLKPAKIKTTKSTKINKTPKTIKQTKPVVVTESPRKSRKKAVA